MAKLREPGENPGRLRHCYGLQTSIATGSARGIGKAGERFEARSQDTNLAVLVVVVESAVIDSRLQRPTSPTKRRMRPALLNCFQRDSLNAFIPRFVGIEGFFILIFNSALVSQSKTRFAKCFRETN
jgi:hypothetical protein